jgi:hypothetical protein
MITTQEIKHVNKTYRNWHRPTVVTQFILDNYARTNTILDFGAGKHATQTAILRNAGYQVYPYDIGENKTENHFTWNWIKKYDFDIVIASNVFNTHLTQDMTKDALDKIIHVGGVLICNLPKKPRFFWKDKKDFKLFLESKFALVQEFDKDIFFCEQ